MSTQSAFVGGHYAAVGPAATVELFPASVEEVFDRLTCIAECDELYESRELRPTADTIEWAKRVLLRVVPRHYVLAAEIDVFHGEIHVSWEKDNKRVVAFLPSPGELKIYLEHAKTTGELEHVVRSVPADTPWAINPYLKWLYA